MGPPRWVWAIYLALFAFSIPWYVPDGPPRLWLGLPHWVVISVGAIGGVAAFTVYVVQRHWPDADEPHPKERRDR